MHPSKINSTKNPSVVNSSNSRPNLKPKLHKIQTENQANEEVNNPSLEDLKNRTKIEVEIPENEPVEQSQVTDSTVENLYYQIEELKMALDTTKKEAEEIKLIAQRTVADSQNMARQHQLDLQSNQKKLKKSVASQILHVINTLYLAFQYSPQTDDQKVIAYLETIKNSFEKSLEDLKIVGIEIMIAHKNDLIDLAEMNIINTPLDTQTELKVAQVVSLGLRIDNQVVQPVTVMV